MDGGRRTNFDVMSSAERKIFFLSFFSWRFEASVSKICSFDFFEVLSKS